MTKTPFETFLESKGISRETADRWGVEDHGNEAHFPYPQGVKIREGLGTPDRGFKFKGTLSLYYRDPKPKPTIFLCEGESDTLDLDQAIHDNGLGEKVSVVGLPGINTWKKEYISYFKDAKRILIVLDNDEDYTVRARVDKAFTQIAGDLGRTRVRRIYLPDGTKDICDFFQNYSFKSFIEIAKPNNRTNYTKLDLHANPPLAEWLVDGLICKGDITLVTGPPNIGKSMVSMGLALAVAEGWPTFLGRKLHQAGPVMCIDEENPLDVVYSRLLGMGMTKQGKDNIHYIHGQGIRLDRNPEKILEDALIIKPVLITIDAMTRVHGKEENDSGAINQLFNEAIIPLGRATGAAVVVIHAVNKGDGTNSFSKIRGSSDFGYAIDNGIEIEPTVATNDFGIDQPALSIKHFKSRRSKRDDTHIVFIDVNPAGDVTLVPAKDGFE